MKRALNMMKKNTDLLRSSIKSAAIRACNFPDKILHESQHSFVSINRNSITPLSLNQSLQSYVPYDIKALPFIHHYQVF